MILEILLRFRTYPVAVVADIEKAFLMISVEPKDCDVLRFLWVEDMTADERHVQIHESHVWCLVQSIPVELDHTVNKCAGGKAT